MTSKLLATTQMAWRATVAVSLAVIIGEVFQLNHYVWATFIALVVTSQSYGESVKQALIRVGMTIMGCSLAWALLASLTLAKWQCLVILAVGLFFFIAYLFTAFGRAMFALGFVIVFLFHLLGIWGWDLWLARIYETAIGCGIGLMVSLIVFPKFASRNVVEQIPKLLNQVCQIYRQALEECQPGGIYKSPEQLQKIVILFDNIATLKLDYYHANYESFSIINIKRRREETILLLHLLTENLVNLLEVLPVLSLAKVNEHCSDMVALTSDCIQRRFDELLARYRQQPTAVVTPFALEVTQIRERLHALFDKKILAQEDFMSLTAFFYYNQRLDELLEKFTELV